MKNIEQIKSEEEYIEQLPQGTPVQDTVTLPLDLKHPDLTWQKYGTITYPINLQNKYGKVYDNGQLKCITQNKYAIAVVKRAYTVFPHDPIDEMVNEFVENPANGLRLLDEPKITSHGINKYWLLIDDKHTFKVEDSFEKNDEMKFGVAIRNSIGGRLAFGCDIFSYRSICMNGAVWGYKDLGSFSMRHFGSDVERMTNALFSTLRDQLGRASEIINYYNKFAQTKLGNNKDLIEKLAENISLKYLPDEDEGLIVKLPNKKKGQERTFTLKKNLQEQSLWDVFNIVTRNLWHQKDLSFDMVRHGTKQLHEVMIAEVAPRPVRPKRESEVKRWDR